MAPKVVPEPSEAARLTSQQTLKNAQFMTMPPLENPFLGKGLVDKLMLATPQQTKVAEQLLDIGIKASITGITAMTLKDVADRATADELNHITALSVAGDHVITGRYLSSLQDKYAPAHTGNSQPADTTLRNTGGNLPLAPQAPGHTGNSQIPVSGVTHTGNTAGVTDTGIKTTITPIPLGPNMDDLAYVQSRSKIEITLKPEKNWESARNKALETVGNLGADSKPVIGRLEVSVGNGKVIGRQSSDGKIGWRVDYDPNQGTHINIWDYSQGKGPGKAVKRVIPFDGNEDSFEKIIKQLNR